MIRVNAVSPGNTYFDGGAWQNVETNLPDLFKHAMSLNPTGRMAKPEEIGRGIVTSRRTVTLTDIVNFACLSGDHNAPHIDHEFCKTQPYGEPIAHGPLVLAIVGGLQCLSGINDGTIIATGGQDHSVKIWDHELGPKQTLTGHVGGVYGIAFAPDGRHLVSGSWDKTLRVWDVNSGKPLETLEGHRDQVRCLAVAPDGQRVISGSSDATALIWKLAVPAHALQVSGQ